MKLRDVAKGTWAIQPITLRLANTVEASQPGAPPSREPVQVKLGVRVLTGDETASVYEKALARAKAKGVEKWEEEQPLCNLFKMAYTLELACVDESSPPNADPEPFFDGGVEQILSSRHVGTDNIVFLYEEWVKWQDACSIRSTEKMTPERAIALVLADMEAPNDPENPLLKLGHTGLVSCIRITASLLFNSLAGKSPSGMPGASGIMSGPNGSEKSTPPAETSS
jgi:hypothetical protein